METQRESVKMLINVPLSLHLEILKKRTKENINMEKAAIELLSKGVIAEKTSKQ